MSKYSAVALLAVEKALSGEHDAFAWEISSKEVFPTQPKARAKSCPRVAFLGLVDAGLVAGISPTRRLKTRNGDYAVAGAMLLMGNPTYAESPLSLWRNIPSAPKTHNAQMHVVIALWKHGRLS